MTFQHRWIKNILEGLDAEVDEKTRVKILEDCGRKCAPQSLISKEQALRKQSKTTAEFLRKLSEAWKHLKIEDGGVYVEYDRCYCPLVRTYKGELSKSFCNCSRGWIKQILEKALEKPVEVKIEKTIKQGASACKFRICLEAASS
jgi:predicted hydrocarbon binding protein